MVPGPKSRSGSLPLSSGMDKCLGLHSRDAGIDVGVGGVQAGKVIYDEFHHDNNDVSEATEEK